MRGANTAREHCAALAGLFAALELPVKLAERAAELESAGRRQAAAEYSRVWDAAVNALEQCCAIMGGMEIEGADFARLYLLTLSQYNVGVIPVSLDMAAAGDLERMRRRHIKHLIILGADEGRLPAPGPEGGVFSADERRALAELGVELDAGDAELWREYTLIYNSVTLPSETLTITSPLFASDGSAREPGLLMRRAAGLFGLKITPVDRAGALLASENTAVDLAASALAGDDSAPAQAALRYFRRADPGRLERIRSAAAIGRGRLSRESALGLYGRDLRLSASRIRALRELPLQLFHELRDAREAPREGRVQGPGGRHLHTLHPPELRRRRAGGEHRRAHGRAPRRPHARVFRALSRGEPRRARGEEGAFPLPLRPPRRERGAHSPGHGRGAARLGFPAHRPRARHLPRRARRRNTARRRGQRAPGRHSRPRGRLDTQRAALSARRGLQDRAQELLALRRVLRAQYADAALPLHPRGRGRAAVRAGDRPPRACCISRPGTSSCRRMPTCRTPSSPKSA